jgi:DNA-binding NtrC family response regulator
MDGLSLLDRLQTLDASLPVVLVTGHGDVAMAVRAMRAGAYDFIEKPFSPDRFVETVCRAIEKRMLRATVEDLRQQLHRKSGIESALLGQSAAMEQVRRRVLKLASTSADVMILGETGTGKELVARCLHDHSNRRDRHFVAINCGGLPETLFESELLGHESGAFTSAVKRRIGKLEHANGGTLLLDEIETMPIGMQIKLLRVLQERKLERLGSNAEVRLDVRVVAATHRDLKAMVADGRFREDLYYRLSTFPIALPPLRERAEDIPLLAVALLARVAPQRRMSLSKNALAVLQRQAFPGNVRELRNVLERAALLADGTSIEPVHVERALGSDEPAAGRRVSGPEVRIDRPASAPDGSLRSVERAALQAQLQSHRGSRAELAQKLGISERSLYRKLRDIGKDPLA